MYHKQYVKDWGRMWALGKCPAHHAAVISSFVGIISRIIYTPRTFRLVLLLLFIFLLCCLVCNSIENIYFSKPNQSPRVLAHVAIIVHTAAWWSQAPSCCCWSIWSDEDPPTSVFWPHSPLGEEERHSRIPSDAQVLKARVCIVECEGLYCQKLNQEGLWLRLNCL